jgi:hypothetical protein
VRLSFVAVIHAVQLRLQIVPPRFRSDIVELVAVFPTPMPHLAPRRAALALLFLVTGVALRAQGAPPMNTDDPQLVAKGVLEINVGFAHTRSADGHVTEFPIFDSNYGLTDTAALSFVLSQISNRPKAGRRESGLSNSTVGVKWRWHDGGKGGALASVHPQLEFNNPGSHSEHKGLADRGGTFLLPVQWQEEFSGWTVTTDVGPMVHFQRADEWHFAASLGRDVTENVTLGAELVCDAAKRLDRSVLVLNFGASVKLSEKHALLLAAGRELHNHGGARATFVGYLGWQVHL